jgi:hypothetical protein
LSGKKELPVSTLLLLGLILDKNIHLASIPDNPLASIPDNPLVLILGNMLVLIPDNLLASTLANPLA